LKIELAYGKGSISLELPLERVQIIKPKTSFSSKDNQKVLEEAFHKPLGEVKLEEAIKGKKVCALIEDGTRSQPYAEEIEAAAGRLKEARFIQYIITTGSHDSQTEENLKIVEFIKESARKNGLNYHVFIHNCEDKDLVEVGITGRGTRVVVEDFTQEADVFFIIANMKNHYFAGYCNAVKNFLPGLCSFQTIEDNHKLALEKEATFGQHPWHPDPERRKNPVSEDMIEAMNLITRGKPLYVLATVGSKRLSWAAFGEIKQVTREGIKIVDEATSFQVTPSKYVIVSPGGYPEDETLYMAQRGLELVKNALQDGGEVLLLASCSGGYEGLGPSEKAKRFFYDSLILDKPKGVLAPEIKKNYRLFKQKAYKLAEMIDRVDKIWFYSELKDEVVKKIHLHPTSQPQKIVNQWLKKDPQAKILIFEEANKLAIYAK
jgi:nickel-dependent lactate racemase